MIANQREEVFLYLFVLLRSEYDVEQVDKGIGSIQSSLISILIGHLKILVEDVLEPVDLARLNLREVKLFLLTLLLLLFGFFSINSAIKVKDVSIFHLPLGRGCVYHVARGLILVCNEVFHGDYPSFRGARLLRTIFVTSTLLLFFHFLEELVILAFLIGICVHLDEALLETLDEEVIEGGI